MQGLCEQINEIFTRSNLLNIDSTTSLKVMNKEELMSYVFCSITFDISGLQLGYACCIILIQNGWYFLLIGQPTCLLDVLDC